MQYSLYDRENGVYQYYTAPFPPEIETDETMTGSFGFFPLQAVSVKFSGDGESNIKTGTVPTGIIATDKKASSFGDVLVGGFGVWLVGKIFGVW